MQDGDYPGGSVRGGVFVPIEKALSAYRNASPELRKIVIQRAVCRRLGMPEPELPPGYSLTETSATDGAQEDA